MRRRPEHERAHSFEFLAVSSVAREVGEGLVDDAIAPMDPARSTEVRVDERRSRNRAVDHVGVEYDDR
jgi:hypothetical protein